MTEEDIRDLQYIEKEQAETCTPISVNQLKGKDKDKRDKKGKEV